MLDLVTYDKLRELQHFAELGRLSASLLHEISNPLAAALLNLELGDQNSLAVRRARRDMKLLWRYVEAARQQLRHQSQPTSFCVQPQLAQLQRVVRPLASQAGVRLDIEAAPGCRLHGDPVKFQQLVTNLVINAVEAYDGGRAGQPAPLVQVALIPDGKWLTIQVTDWGKGIDTEALDHVFDAFYTTKGRNGHGLGVGLAIVKHYVTVDFGGSIKVESSGGGTRFTIKLPVI